MRSFLARVPAGRRLRRCVGLLLASHAGTQPESKTRAKRDPGTPLDPFEVPPRDRIFPICEKKDLEAYLQLAHKPSEANQPPPTVVAFMDDENELAPSPQCPELAITQREVEKFSLPAHELLLDAPLGIPATKLRKGLPKKESGFVSRIREVEEKMIEYRRLRWFLIRKCREAIKDDSWAVSQMSPREFTTTFLKPEKGTTDIPAMVYPEDALPSLETDTGLKHQKSKKSSGRTVEVPESSCSGEGSGSGEGAGSSEGA
jgi:hypothetical protein